MHAFKSYFSPDQDQPGAPGGGLGRSPSKSQANKPGPLDLRPPPGPGPLDASRWSSSTAGGGEKSGSGSRTQQSQGRPAMNNRKSTASLAPYLSGNPNRMSNNSMTDIKAEVTVSCLYQDLLRKLYAQDWNLAEGVVLKKSRGSYVCAPAQLREIPNGFFDMMCQLNVSCAITVNTPVVQSIIGAILQRPLIDAIPLPDGLQLQVLPRMTDLPRCQKHHFAAFILEPPVLVVWDDDPNAVLNRAEELEQKIIKMIWKTESEEDEDEEKGPASPGIEGPDLEEGPYVPEPRPVRITSSLIVAIALGLSIACLGLGWRWLAFEIATDGSYVRLALLATMPVLFFISLFFYLIIATDLFQILGPISAVHTNSKHYSGRPPRRLNRYNGELPHVTIQMPVYKEGLNAVIRPTVMSLKAAISTYEMQGGTANIFVNDDGMQLITYEQAQARREFYEEHNIGWVSRPKHNPKPNGDEKPFLRKGKFKKASNMNYCLAVSNRIEDKLKQVRRGQGWTQDDENEVYEQSLVEVLNEDGGRTWAEGNVRVGDYILIIDSDTRVPSDCLLDAVSELEQSPEVAILQHTSSVLTVSDSYFERGVCWFTNLIYSCVTFTVANGDICPFVGHNAFLRWRAIQDAAAWVDPDDGVEKFWSESHVSEDFDMALRLQSSGYILRFATYSNGGFQEGVSLTVYDELARWQKYAFGVNELIFNPFRLWVVRGPFAPVFIRFITSKIHFYQKITILAYIGTYYGIGAAWILSFFNYFLTGWFFGLYDKYYMDSFSIYFSIVIVFPVLGNVALGILRYRLGEMGLLQAWWINIKWIPLFAIFLGGLSLHVSKALLCHFFEIPLSWQATAKEVEDVNFIQELPKLIQRFWGTLIFCLICTALMVCGAFVFPIEWRITTFASIYPLAQIVVCHFSLPVLLNPALMKFTF